MDFGRIFSSGVLALIAWETAIGANPPLTATAIGEARITKSANAVSQTERDALKKEAFRKGNKICHTLLTDKATVTHVDQGLADDKSKHIGSTYRISFSAQLNNPNFRILVPHLIKVLEAPYNLFDQTIHGAQLLLGQIGETAIPDLLTTTLSSNADQRHAALEVLVSSADDGMLPFSAALNNAIVSRTIAMLADTAPEGAGRLSIEKTAEEFLKSLKIIELVHLDALIQLATTPSKGTQERSAAARILGDIKENLGARTADAVTGLVRVLEMPVDDSNEDAKKLRDAVVLALAKIGDPAVPSLVPVLQNSKDEGTRLSAGLALAQIISSKPLPIESIVPLLLLDDAKTGYAAALSVRNSLLQEGNTALGKHDKTIAIQLFQLAIGRKNIPGSSANPTEAALSALATMGPLAAGILDELLHLISGHKITDPSQAEFASQVIFAIAKILRTTPHKVALAEVRNIEKMVTSWYMSGATEVGPSDAARSIIALEIMEGKRDPDSE